MSDDKLDLDRMVEKYIWLGAEEYTVCGLVCDYRYAECMYDFLGLPLIYPIIHHTYGNHIFQSQNWKNVLFFFSWICGLIFMNRV